MSNTIKKFYDGLYAVVMFICKMLLIADVCITSYAVLGRYVGKYIPFISDPAWSEEIVLTCMIYMAFLSASLAIRNQAHIRMTSLDMYLPKKLCQTLDLVADFLILAFALMMVFVGFGWARPVPVNPRNYKHYRRDDLLVSLAGITMNLILFVTGCVVMYALVGVALSRAAANTSNDAYFLEQYGGQLCYFMKGVDYTYLPVSSVLTYAPYLSDYLIAPVFGEVAKYLYEMLMYFTVTNLILAVFNLIPVPPLDGYHVLNDLILRKRNLFVSPRVSQVFMVILFVLMLSGYTDFIFDWVLQTALSGVGRVAGAVFSAVGIL